MNENYNEREIFTLAGFLIVLCAAVGVVVWWYVHKLNTLREEYDTTEFERSNIVTEIDRLTAIQSNLEKLKGLDLDAIKPASDIVEFYSHVRKAADNNGVNILTTAQSQKTVTIVLRGGYYSFVNLLADWRAMPQAGKITAVKFVKDPSAPALFILANVTLTAY